MATPQNKFILELETVINDFEQKPPSCEDDLEDSISIFYDIAERVNAHSSAEQNRFSQLCKKFDSLCSTLRLKFEQHDADELSEDENEVYVSIQPSKTLNYFEMLIEVNENVFRDRLVNLSAQLKKTINDLFVLAKKVAPQKCEGKSAKGVSFTALYDAEADCFTLIRHGYDFADKCLPQREFPDIAREIDTAFNLYNRGRSTAPPSAPLFRSSPSAEQKTDALIEEDVVYIVQRISKFSQISDEKIKQCFITFLIKTNTKLSDFQTDDEIALIYALNFDAINPAPSAVPVAQPPLQLHLPQIPVQLGSGNMLGALKEQFFIRHDHVPDDEETNAILKPYIERTARSNARILPFISLGSDFDSDGKVIRSGVEAFRETIAPHLQWDPEKGVYVIPGGECLMLYQLIHDGVGHVLLAQIKLRPKSVSICLHDPFPPPLNRSDINNDRGMNEMKGIIFSALNEYFQPKEMLFGDKYYSLQQLTEFKCIYHCIKLALKLCQIDDQALIPAQDSPKSLSRMRLEFAKRVCRAKGNVALADLLVLDDKGIVVRSDIKDHPEKGLQYSAYKEEFTKQEEALKKKCKPCLFLNVVDYLRKVHDKKNHAAMEMEGSEQKSVAPKAVLASVLAAPNPQKRKAEEDPGVRQPLKIVFRRAGTLTVS